MTELKKEAEKKIQLLQRADYSGAGLPAFAPTMKQITLYRELAQLELSAGNPEDAAAAYSELNDVLDKYMRSIGSYPGSYKLHNPRASTHIQTLIFDRGIFNKKMAASWAKAHGFNSSKIDENSRSYRIRQEQPSHFKVMRTIELRPGVKAVVGR